MVERSRKEKEELLSLVTMEGSPRKRASVSSMVSHLEEEGKLEVPSPRILLEVPKKDLSQRFLGLGLALFSGVLMTAYSSMLKLLVETDSLQVVVVRGVLQLLAMLAVVLWRGLDLRAPREARMAATLLLVAATGGLRILFIFTSFSRIPLGDATTILFSSPVIVMALSPSLLQEDCGVFRCVAAASLVTGVVLIAKPPLVFGASGQLYDLVGYTLVLLAMGMSAIGIVFTKLISKAVEKAVILFYLGLATSVCGGLGLATVGSPNLFPPLWEWGLAVTIAILGMVQQYCLIWAVQLESPARVTVIRTLQIVLAYGVQVGLFGQLPLPTDLFGAAMVITTVVAITFEKQITDKLSWCNSQD